MARFVMANRRAGKFDDAEKISSRDAMATVMAGSFMTGASIVAQNTPKQETARHVVVFEANSGEMAAKAAELPADVMVEPEILHYAESVRTQGFQDALRTELDAPFDFGTTRTLRLRITGDGAPLAHAEVIFNLIAFGSIRRQGSAISDQNGRVEFRFSSIFNVSAAVVVPAGNFWTMVAPNPANNDEIDCPQLPPADKHLGWWHERLGITRYAKTRGRGIKVGVADTGLGPHDELDHVQDIGAFIDGDFLPNGGADVDAHGSHVSGSIGARPTAQSRFGGIAPGVKLFSARVFPPGRGANQADIANAIDELSRTHEVDLINLSLGSDNPSIIEQDAIVDAVERGTLCVCAAGNSNGPVGFPAAFPETLAISAIGLEGWGPTGSLASLRMPNDFARIGDHNLFHANFSCFGPEISGAAPGVGIISTVPERHGLERPYGVMDGTSMASPIACGALAAALAGDKEYKNLPRNSLRTEHARRKFDDICRSIGLDSVFQGSGMPFI